MILFLSDLHLGRGTAEESRRAERDAVSLLETHREDLLKSDGRLVLLGDVFDAYMEYGAMVPAGFSRLLGALASLSDAGVPVTYIVGNRDCWHLGHLAEDVGMDLVRDSLTLAASGKQIFAAHGDGLVQAEKTTSLLKPLFRSQLAYRLYRNVLPGDSGFRIARRIARRGSGEPEHHVVAGLRRAAREILESSEADIVVMGHSHHAECSRLAAGTYLNPGYWFKDRTFGTLDASGPAVRHFHGSPNLHAQDTNAPQQAHSASRYRRES